MKPTTFVVATALALATALRVRAANADEVGCASINRANIVSCALAASLATKSEQLGLESLEGRRRAAGVLLPSNPSVALSGGYTIEPSLRPADRELVWSAGLSQELEVAGQRGKRLDVVRADQRGQQARVVLAQRDAAAIALVAYFDALAANEEARIAERLAELATALRTVASARAQAGVGSDLDAQLAEAAATRLVQAEIAAQQRVATTTAALATVVGLDPARVRPRADGDLLPLAVVDVPGPALVDTAIARRAEVSVALAEKDAHERRVALYERLRIPNPTLSLSVRKDWIGEETVNVGVGFPIPFPAPIGRTYAGEIAEAASLARRAETDAERLRRTIRLEVTTAQEAVLARKRQADLYPADRVRRTVDTLRTIAQEIDARRLPVREALLTQQALIDFLFASVEVRRGLCFASVELARTAGLPLERGAQ